MYPLGSRAAPVVAMVTRRLGNPLTHVTANATSAVSWLATATVCGLDGLIAQFEATSPSSIEYSPGGTLVNVKDPFSGKDCQPPPRSTAYPFGSRSSPVVDVVTRTLPGGMG